MKAFTYQQREAIRKAKIKQEMKKARDAAEKIKHVKKQAEKARYETQCPSGSQVEAAWKQRKRDTLPQIEGTVDKLPIKHWVRGEGGALLKRINCEVFIQAERYLEALQARLERDCEA